MYDSNSIDDEEISSFVGVSYESNSEDDDCSNIKSRNKSNRVQNGRSRGSAPASPYNQQRPNNNNDNNNLNLNRNVNVNRILMLLLLCGLVAVSICLQSLHNHFTEMLSKDELKIAALERKVIAQKKIIDRFNESVTNADVLDDLEGLKRKWDVERSEVSDQVEKTRTKVGTELNSTMIQLDEMVLNASIEIQDEVDNVKKNFDQYVIHTKNEFSLHNNFMWLQVAGTFTVLSCLISMWHMSSHTRKMNQPAIQRKILAILWMCPIYAFTSWLSLAFPYYSGYLGIIKDSYEAYVIYQFLSFCISVIGGGDRNKVIDLLAKQADHLSPPTRFVFCCGKPHYKDDRELANAILTQCQVFTMQLIFWKPCVSFSHVLLKYYYVSDDENDDGDWKSPQFWIKKMPMIIENISIFFAFSGLLKFYHIVEKELEWCRPFAKFLCIKGVVFMTFWQGMALQILAATTNYGKDGGEDSTEDWSEGIQNILICLEMLLFSVAHFYCFPVEEWQPGYKAEFRKGKFGETLALNDFFTDLKIVMTAQNNNSSSKKKEKSTTKSVSTASTTTISITPSEETILEEDCESETGTETEPGSIRSMFRSDNDEAAMNRTQEDQSVRAAQRRLSNMLDDMLFSPKNSTNDNDNDNDNDDDDESTNRNNTFDSDDAIMFTDGEEIESVDRFTKKDDEMTTEHNVVGISSTTNL